MSISPRSLFLAGVVVLLLAGCGAPSTMSRVNANRALYDTWPPEIKEAVLSQKAIPGMNPDMVRVALGQPTQVMPGTNPGEEIWVYRRGGSSSEGSGTAMQIGANIGGMQIGTGGGGGGGGGSPSDDDAGEVMFKDGLVVRSNVIP